MNEFKSEDGNTNFDSESTREIIDFTRAFEGDEAAQEISNEARQELKDVFESLAYEYALQDADPNDPDFENIKATHFEAIIDSGTTEEEARAMLSEVRTETHDDIFELIDGDDDDEIMEDDDEHFLGDPEGWKKAA